MKKEYKLEYVVSGCGRMQLFHKDMLTDKAIYQEFHDRVVEIPKNVVKSVQDHSQYSEPVLSMLFNAFTEKAFVKPSKGFQMYDWLGSDGVYADSGGLQIVTTGKSITPEIKQEIYKTQMVADYAMCFDVIPLTSSPTAFRDKRGNDKTRSSNERSNTGNKIFEDHLFAESAMATAKNIKEQVSYFREHNAKTKVIIIVQGNTPQDMKFFYDTIASQLTEEDYEHVGGIAIADTCMGNGELESIKMLHAAHLIAQDCHENAKSHVHFLGIGSLYRLRPIIYLVRSGFLQTFKRISYDSTSHTSCFDMGLIKLDGTCRSYGVKHTPLAEEVFTDVYNTFKGTFEKLVDLDTYKKIVFGVDNNTDITFTNIRSNAQSLGTNAHIAGMLIKTAHTFYQIENFMKNAEGIWGEGRNGEEMENTPVSHLLNINDEGDILQWYQHFTGHISSSAIRRRSETATFSLLDF